MVSRTKDEKIGDGGERRRRRRRTRRLGVNGREGNADKNDNETEISFAGEKRRRTQEYLK